MRLTIEVWRQAGPAAKGAFEPHELDGLDRHMSVLELLDALNERLVEEGKEAVAFESDCRERVAR